MPKHEVTKIFGERKIRTVWDDKAEKWYFSVVDVIAVLTDSIDPHAYWRKLKQRLKEEGNQTVTSCHALKLMAADGKMRKTDVADQEQLFRLIQSIPSPKAEPFKMWMARVASERLDQFQDPELSIQQALADYRRLGYSEKWIARRIKSIEIRKDLTDEWKARGLNDESDYAKLTNTIYKTWAGMTAGEYKRFKGLKKQNLRDNMTNMELILSMLAEESTREISASTLPRNMVEHHKVAASGGSVAKNARLEIERKTGRKVISPLNASDTGALDVEGSDVYQLPPPPKRKR
ncbi:MAG: Bro-N domain-containing protein [Kiritimatiellae bacterium]|nr:Bro-N domain-containing protein [Kiritimatiellia bacterium]